MSAKGIVERLRRTEKRKSYLATNRTAPIIENDYDALVNPDGPEAAERIERLEAALRLFGSFGCPVCNGDCASANPPVAVCPMQEARAALSASNEGE